MLCIVLCVCLATAVTMSAPVQYVVDPSQQFPQPAGRDNEVIRHTGIRNC